MTPDSFSDGGRFRDPGAAVRQALRMEKEGAHILDVGGESSRPGARRVSAKEELGRILPVLRRLSGKIGIPISIDTHKPEVAHAALDHGAVIVNDIRALRGGKRMAKLIARYGAGVVLMHMRGNPSSMQKNPRYRDLLKEVRDALKRSVNLALEAGIPKSRIVVDPGFGFGKTPEHNLRMLATLDFLSPLGVPVLVGLSRKSFIGKLTGADVPADRLYGSLAAASAAVFGGAHILRVHDIRPHRQLCAVLDALGGL